MHFIAAHFDSTKAIDAFLSAENWRACHDALDTVLNILEKQPELRCDLIRAEDALAAQVEVAREKEKELKKMPLSRMVVKRGGER